jgi:hypothetical protein
MKEFTKKFKEGLDELGITYEEIEKEYKYCGGDHDSHLNYYEMLYPGEKLPPHEENCVCGQNIMNNCYVTNGEKMIVMGNCCIKRFMKKSGRTCSVCGAPHRNRIINKCNECKYKCEKCNRKKENNGYKVCYWCYRKSKDTKGAINVIKRKYSGQLREKY